MNAVPDGVITLAPAIVAGRSPISLALPDMNMFSGLDGEEFGMSSGPVPIIPEPSGMLEEAKIET